MCFVISVGAMISFLFSVNGILLSFNEEVIRYRRENYIDFMAHDLSRESTSHGDQGWITIQCLELKRIRGWFL